MLRVNFFSITKKTIFKLLFFLFIFGLALYFFPKAKFFQPEIVQAVNSCTSAQAGDWNTASTWSNCGGTVPQDGDSASVSHAVTIGAYTINQINNLTIASGGTVTQNNTNTHTITGTLTVQSGGTLNHGANTTAQSYKIDFTAAAVSVDSGGSINVDGKGYTGGTNRDNGNGPAGGGGTGSGNNYGGGGGAHAGNGGYAYISASANTAGGAGYCSFSSPATIGAGAGAGYSATGGAGGGLVILNVSGTVTINGTVSAAGTNGGTGTYGGGGGGGGGIKIVADTIAGTPTSLNAAGGNGSGSGAAINYGGGGGGGCVYLQYTTANSISAVSSYLSIKGGTGYQSGGAGVAYIKQASGNGDLYAINNGTAGASTPQIDSSITADSLTLQNGVAYIVTSTKTLALNNADPLTASNSTSTLRVSNGTLSPNTSFTISNVILELWSSATLTNGSNVSLTVGSSGTFTMGYFTTSGTALTLNSFTVNSGGLVNHLTNSTAQTHVINISAGTVTINSGGSINANGLGYSGGAIRSNGSGPAGGAGTGSGNDYGGGGGAHGGNGGGAYPSTAGGTAYCNNSSPGTVGAGGGGGYSNVGGAGGGLIIFNVSGTITVNGSISATGTDGGSSGTYGGGGGGGGGVKIVANTIAGTPSSFTIAGGNGTKTGINAGGGGGGGCVFLQYTNTNSIVTSTVTVSGGTGYVAGSSGSYKTSYVPASISISLTTDGVINFGNLGLEGTSSTVNAQIVSIDSGPANLTIKSTNFTTSSYTWFLGASSGANQVKWEFASTTPNWSTFSEAETYYPLDNNVAQGQTRNIYFQITLPSETDAYGQYGSTVTILAASP